MWQRKQFSWTHDGKSDNPKHKKAWEKAQRIALFALTTDNKIVGDDVTHYHATIRNRTGQVLMSALGKLEHIFSTRGRAKEYVGKRQS